MAGESSRAGDHSLITSHQSFLQVYGVGAVAGSFFFCFFPSSRAGGFAGALAGGPGATRSMDGGSFFGGFAGSLEVSRFGFSAAAGFAGSGGKGRICLPSGLGGAATDGGPLLSSGLDGGAVMAGSGLRLSVFSFGGLGATLGAAVSVAPEAGGTDALGAISLGCLFLPLSRVAPGLIPGATEAAGAAFMAGVAVAPDVAGAETA